MSTLTARGPTLRDCLLRLSQSTTAPPPLRTRRRRGKLSPRRLSVQRVFEELENYILLSASIVGTVWNDQSGDGVRQQSDPGVAGETVFLDLNHDHTNDNTSVTVAGSTTLAPSPGELGAVAGGLAATLQVQGFPATISDLQVNLDLVDNQPAGSAPVAVGVVSPLGITVPDLPTLINIQPGQSFDGSFDQSAATPITLATPNGNGVIAGTFQPQNSFTEPPAHIYDGNPNGTWGLVFFGNTTGLVLNSWSLTFKLADPTATTNASGNYTFSNLVPGTYDVEIPGTPGQSQTSPAGTGTAQTVTVADGQTASGVDFGIQPASELATEKFYLSSQATAWGQPVTINYTITNQGNGDAPAFDVGVVLSNDGAITAQSPVLQTLSFPAGLAAGASMSGSVTVTLPAAPPSGFTSLASTEIGFLIDPSHALAHNNPATDANQGPGYDMTELATTANVAVTTNPQAQDDPSIAVDPNNRNHIVVAYMDFSLVNTGYAGIGVSVSEDGGQTWTESALPLPVGFSQGAAHPTVQFNAQGQVFVSFIAATFLGPQPGLTEPAGSQRLDGFQSNNGIFVSSSTNGGTTWAQPVPVASNMYTGTDVNFEDDPSFGIDTFKTLPDGQPNPYYDDLYVTWVRVYSPGQFPGDPQSTAGTDIMLAVSQDGGQTWSTQMQNQGGTQITVIKDPNYATDGTGSSGHGDMFYPQVTIGPQGDIYVSAYAAGGFDVFHSTDNGASFVAPNPAEGLGLPFPGINVLPYPTLFADDFRTNSVRDIVADPSDPGRVYVSDANYVFDAAVGGVVDSGEILFAVSNDYGQTWDPIFQVGKETTNLADLPPGENDAFLSVLNDDDNGNFTEFDSGAQLNDEVLDGQVFPSMAVDEEGALTVIWYDTRLDPTQQNLDVYGVVSTDGGKTFSPNFRVTDTTFNPNDGNFTDANGNTNDYLGDHIGVVAVNGTAYAVWTTTEGGNQNIDFQTYSLTTPPAPPVDRLYPDNTPQTATHLGFVSALQNVPELTVGAANDNWFSLTAGASGDIVVTATASAGDGQNLQLQLTDANGDPLEPPPVVTPILDPSGTVIGSQLVYSGSVAGETYLVHVGSGDQTSIPYALAVSSLTADLGTSVQGTEAGNLPQGGLSLYRLEAAVTGSINLTLTPGSDPQDNFTLQVLGPNGQTVLASGPAAGSGAPQTITLPVTQGEVVLIQVAGGDPNAASSSFTIQYTNFDQYETPNGQTLFFPTPSPPSSIAAGDLSSNGIDDIVTSSVVGADPVNVLMANGNGTFQAPRQYDVGPGQSGALTAGYRQVALADLTGNGVEDIVVPNFRAGDISVLLGNGNGTFQPQRTFDAVSSADSLVTGNFTTSGTTDVAVLQNFSQEGGVSDLAILIGRGDGTFEPAVLYATIFNNGAGPMVVGDFTGNGIDDIMVFSKNEPEAEFFLGNGDGTFRVGGVINLPENVFAAQAADLTGNGKLDLITTGTNTGNVYVMMGNGDGTFQAPQTYTAMAPNGGNEVGVYGLAVADFGSPSDSGPGAPDGVPDIIVTAQNRSGSGPGEVIMLPGSVNSAGQYTLGTPVVLADVATAGKIAVGDFTGNGATDIAATDNDGVLVIYGQAPNIPANTTAATARDLGSAAHVVTQPQAIVAGYEDAYYTYHVPTEDVPGSGAEVVDFSALFQDIGGAGIGMDVLNAAGDVLGSGDRFRVVAAQGSVLTVHVFGEPAAQAGGLAQGSGVYTLDVDVLPQVVSVHALSPIPGGPVTSIVLTFQGDSLDPAPAQDPANYSVILLGPGGGVVPIAASSGGQPIVYDPGVNIDVTSGLTYPTAVDQTVTLLFTQPLAAGSYEIVLSPAIQAAAYNAAEAGELAPGDGSFAGHPVVTVTGALVVNGARLTEPGLVTAPVASTAQQSAVVASLFLTELQGDLAALLDQGLRAAVGDSAITTGVNDEILAQYLPLYLSQGTVSTGQTPPSFTIIWLDPVSIDLQSPQGVSLSYNLSTNALSNGLGSSFVSVGGNVEMIVMENAAGTFNLDVANVAATAQGGAVELSANGFSSEEFTAQLQGGETGFQLDLGGENTSAVASAQSPGGITGPAGAPETSAAVFAGPVSFAGATNAAFSTGSSGATTAAVQTGGATGAGQPLLTTYGQSLSGDSAEEQLNERQSSNGLPSLQSILQVVKQVMSGFSGVMDALGRKSPAAVLRQLSGMLDKLSGPGTPAAANDHGARNDEVKDANPGPGQTAPSAMLGPAPQSTPGPGGIDTVLWDHGIDGLLQERSRSGSAAFLAAAFLATGLVGSELDERPAARSTSARQRRSEPRE